MNKKSVIWILLFSFMTLKALSAEKKYQIEISGVTQRSLFGGLGSSKEPIGGVTEFFVPELSAPLVSIAGLHADRFTNHKIYIFKQEKYYLCPSVIYNESCFDCPECGLPERQTDLKNFDVSKREFFRKKMIKSLQPSAMTDQGGNNQVDFQFPVKGGQPLTLTAKHGAINKNVNPLAQFQNENKIYVFKSQEDENFYLCPKSTFSESCYVCTDCSTSRLRALGE